MKCRSNGELLRAARELVSRVRGVTRELLVELGEVDVRRLYLEEACPSMFAFCTTRLGFSEDVAYKRIQVAGGHKPAGCGSGPGFRGGAASGSGAGGCGGRARVDLESGAGGSSHRTHGGLRPGTQGGGIAAAGASVELAPGRAEIGTPEEKEHNASADQASTAPEVETSAPDERATAPNEEPSSSGTEPSAAAALYRLSLTVGKEFAEKLRASRSRRA